MQDTTFLKPDEQDYSNLVAAVLKSACQPRHPRYPSKGGEGLGYLTTPGGQFWLGLIDIDPASIQRLTTLSDEESSHVTG